jgi:hypothetical protein
MIILDENTQKAIAKLNPMEDSRFLYDIRKWEKLSNDHRSLIREYENNYISRLDIVDAYSDYFGNERKNVIKPFLMSFIWGFANSGYGQYRTLKYINSKENIAIFESALDHLSKKNASSMQQAFKKLGSIKGLGISYFTKILYFSTKALNYERYALIFDIRVAQSLLRLTAKSEITNILNVTPSKKFNDYIIYNKLMHDLSIKYNLDAEKIEMYLFEKLF